MRETKNFSFKWDKDLNADRYIIHQWKEDKFVELVRIDNVNIASLIVPEIVCGTENHFVVSYLKKRGNKWIEYRQEDYYGFVNKKRSVTYPFSIPKLKCAKRNGRNVYFEWEKSGEGITYLVARRISGKAWTRIALTEQTFFVDENVDEDSEFFYTARCIEKDGATMLSSFSNRGIPVEK